MRRSPAVLIVLTVAGALACQNDPSGADSEAPAEAPASEAPAGNASATARLQDVGGESAGTATFTETGAGVQVRAEFSNLAPGPHAVHIHDMGACEPPDFKSAGEHFQPDGKQHGFENPEGPHAGDLPNIIAGEDGTATLEANANRVSLREGAENSLLKSGGTALVVHAGADDYRTDPAGDSGDRVACGVIEPSR
jgi:Cu-Zn family superoxide dismutase